MFRAVLVAFLTLLQIYPLHLALAQQQDDQERLPRSTSDKSEDDSRPATPEALVSFAAVQAENGYLPNLAPVLRDDAVHIGLLIEQSLVRHNSDGTVLQHWDLGVEDIELPKIGMPDGVLERSALVRWTEHGFELSHKGSLYARKFRLPPGETLVNWVADSDYIRVLTRERDTYRIYAVTVLDLRARFYTNKVPVARVAEISENIDPKSEYRLVQITRRASNQDQSLAAREGTLDLREDWRNYQIGVASPESLALMKDNFEQVKAIDIEEGKVKIDVFTAGDDVLVKVDPETGRSVIDRPPLARDALYIASELLAQQIEAMKIIANGEEGLALARRKNYTNEQQKIVNELLSSTDSLMSFFVSGRFQNMDSVHQDYVTAMQTSAAAGRETNSLRDQFTPEEWNKDTQVLAETIESAKIAMREQNRLIPRIARSIYHAFQNQVGPFERNRMNKLTKFLQTARNIAAPGMLVYAADHLLNSGQGRQLALQYLAGYWDWSISKIPVLGIPGYPPLLAMSGIAQYVPIVGLFTAFALISPFTQFSTFPLAINTQIRAYGRYLLTSPLKWAARATAFAGGESWLAAMSKGHVAGLILDRQAAEDVSEKIRADHMRVSIAKAVGLMVIAKKMQVDPGALLLESKDPDFNSATEEGFEQAVEVSEYLRGYLDGLSDDQVSKALEGDKQLLHSTIVDATAAAERLIADQESVQYGRERWFNYFRLVATRKILQAIATFQEATVTRLENARASAFVVNTTISGFFVDYTISLLTMMGFGAMADPASPQTLHAQADRIGYTHPVASGENLRQIPAHMAAGAADSHLQFSDESIVANAQHRAASIIDDSEKVVKRQLPVIKELGRYLSTALDLRGFTGVEMAARRLKISFTLLNASLLMNIPIRTLIMDQSLYTAFAGHIEMMFLGVFGFAYPWYLYYSFKYRHETPMQNRLAEFEAARSELKRAVDVADVVAIHKFIFALEGMYQKADFTYDDRPTITSSDASAISPVETVTQQGTEYYRYALTHPAFAYKSRERLNTAMLVGVAVSTTYLLSYLFLDTVNSVEPVWAFDWTTLSGFNLFAGMPKGDGPISIAMKSVGLMWTIVLGKRGFDYAWDSALVKVPVLKLWLSAKGDLERIENRRSVTLAKLKAANPLTWFKNTAAKAWRAVAGAPRKDLSSLKECQDSF